MGFGSDCEVATPRSSLALYYLLVRRMPFPAPGLALLCVEVIPASVISFPYHTHSTYCMLAGKHAMGYRKCLTDTIKATNNTNFNAKSHTSK